MKILTVTGQRIINPTLKSQDGKIVAEKEKKKEPNKTSKKRKLDIDETESKRRSDLAKRLHAEGKFGGKQKGSGRPKKERAQEQVAAQIKEEGDNIMKALRAALKSDSPSVKLKAALAMLEIESKEEEFQMRREDRMYDNYSRDKLIELITGKIKQLSDAGVKIPGINDDIIDAEAVEIKAPALNE